MVTSRSHLGFASAIALAVVSMLIAGCASTDDNASGHALTAVAAPVTTPPTTGKVTDSTKCVKSLAPGPLPAPMQMPTGSYMAEIQSHNKLTVGVDQNTLFFGYRNPRTNELAGFDIDVARLIARAIFGDDQGHIDYVIVNTSERMPAVAGDPGAGQSPKVDMVASLVTMTCARLNDSKYPVLFSSQYFDAAQGLLIRSSDHGKITGTADLANRRVCATRGSTSSSHMRELQPKVKMVEVANRTECLVALQEGRVDAITADNTILYGFKRQDRTTEILPVELSDEPYGLAFNTAHPDFVRFVNAVLQQNRDDGTLERLANDWGRQAGVDFPPIPPAQYQDGS